MANEVAPWEEANNLEPFDVVVPKGVEPMVMAKDIQAGKIPIKQPPTEETPWVEESAPWEEDKMEVSTAGVGILPSMPEKRPAVIPKPKEQMKVHSMVDSLPKELSVEVKKEAIQKQREKKYGVIKSAPAFTLSNAIENIPQNMEDIVAETGSLIMNIGRLAKNALVDHDELNKQLEPAVKLTGAVIKDWQSMFKGETPKEIEKLPIGQALNQQFEKIERQGVWTTLGQFAEKRPIDALLIGQAAKTAVSGGVRVTAKGFSKVVPKGTAIGDKVDSFLSTERTPVVFEMPVEVDGVTTPAKTIEFPREYSTDPLTKYIYEKSFDKVLDVFPKAKTAFADHKANQLIDKIRSTYEQGNFIERQKLIDESMGMINTLSKEEQAIIVPYLEGRASLIGDTSEQFQKFETWYRDLSGKITGELSEAGKLAPEQIRARLYQPIEKATGMTIDDIVAEFGDFTPAYIHHTFPERFGQKMGDFFADTTGKRYTPSFLKRSQGVAGYTEDLKEILPKWTAQYVKFKNTEAFINDLTSKFGIPVNIKQVKQVAGGIQVGDKVYNGYKIVAPDGFLNFYRGNVDFYKEVSKRLESMDFDESVADAILTSFEGQGKQFMGVSKNRRVFLVPDNVAKRLESYATPLFGSQKAQTVVKLAYDKPTQFWKDMTLAAAPRWIKNNVLGDVFFNTMEGVGPLSYGRSFTSKYRDIIPDELIRASFANTMKYNPKLGTAAHNTIGRLAQIIGETMPIKVASKAKDIGYGLNTIFETPFVRGLYVKLAREQAVRLLNAQKIPVTEENIMAQLAEFKSNPALREPLINKIQSTLPVFDLTGNLERKYLKRLMPFYNWYKFMAVYAAKLPVNHPFKTVALRGLGALSEQQREQAFIEMFPYMKREIEENGVPDRFDNMWPIKMEEDGKALFFNTRGMNVFTTVEDMLRGDVLNMLSPLVKIPIERSSGRETFTNREYKTGDAGADYQGKEKQVPPLGEHILNQFQQYKLIKQSLVPAQQYDSGTLMNPEPILDKITGEYKYPIESVEKWFNYIGIDTRTTDVRKVFDSYKQQKAAAIGETFNKQQSKADTALTLNDIKGILQELKSDKVRWNKIVKEIQANEKQKGIEQKKIFKKVRNEDLRSFLQPKNEYDVYPIAANLIRGLGYERPVRDTLGKVPIVGDIAADMLLSPFSAYSYGVGQISAKYASKLSGTTNPSIKSALSMQKKIDKAVDGGRTEFAQNPDKPFFEKNTDYVLSVDPDVLCQKSAGADLAVQKLKSSLGDKYTNDMAFELIAAAKERQLRVACPQCYVFSARSKPGVAMQKKVVVGEGGYAGQINKLTAHQMDILTEKALRNYSSTDFKPTHLPGQIVQKVEAAKRGIPEASYTKEPVYADIFGPTGEYINMSIGRNADISMDVNAAMKARGKYPNVSTIYVGFTDAEVRTAINNPMVDHGIPWHSSGQKVEQMRKTLNDPDVHDYTGWQNETVVAKTAKKTIKSAHKIYDSEHGGDLNTYLGLAKRRNVIPKFPQFIMKDKGISDGLMDVIEGMKQSKTQSTKPLYDYINTHQENINPNYMKLIGPEYGKFGGEYPYKPSDMSKINIRKAQSELSRYLKDPESLIPRRQDFLDIADQLIKKYK